jgi:hypothetical protein
MMLITQLVRDDIIQMPAKIRTRLVTDRTNKYGNGFGKEIYTQFPKFMSICDSLYNNPCAK